VFYSIRDLEVRAASFDVELPPGVIGSIDPKYRQTGPLKAAGKVELVSESLGEIRVKGHLTVRMEADCDRCLEPAGVSIDSDFELSYWPVSEGAREETAIDGDEADIGFYDGDGLELNDVLREFVLLSLPMQRLCTEDCKGICPVCGQNRNKEEACHCQADAADDRWAALKEVSGLK
jgi:uncharacterized protein